MPKQALNKEKEKRGLNKSPKKLVPNQEIELCIPKDQLPEGAVFSSFEERFVQDLEIKTVVTLFKRARYKLLDGKYIYAPLPGGFSGSFGPTLKQYILHQSQACNVSQAKIHQTLLDFGIQISEGEINNILLEEADKLEADYNEVAQAGIETADVLCTDDTGARHKNNNGVCLVIQNKFFAYFRSSSSKSRKNFLMALRTRHKDYVFNDVSLEYILRYNPKSDLILKLQSILDIVCEDKNAWDALLEKHNINRLNTGLLHLRVLEEAA